MFSAKDRTEAIIDLIWDHEKYYIASAGDQAPTKKELQAFAASYGVKFPKEYIAHASGYWGGLYLDVKEEFWPRHKAGDIGPFWSFLYGIFIYAYSSEAPEWMQLKVAADEFKEMGHKVIPFMKVIGDADVYCFDENGKIQRWSHELDTFDPYDGSFFDALKFEFLELESRRKDKLVEIEATN